MIRVVHFGLGPIGIGVAKLVAKRGDMQIVGAVDIDPAKVGKELGALLGDGQKLGVTVTNDVKSVVNKNVADIVVLTTASALKKVKGQLETIVNAGLPVISTCEELSYPQAHNAELVSELDALARKNGVAIYATGVNPGFVMDALPIFLTAPCADVKRIRIVRMQDAGVRRLPFQQKIGAGITREEFQKRVADGSVRHVGLRESITMIADSFGWTLSDYKEVIDPVIAKQDVTTPFLTVKAGTVAGVDQSGIGYVNGEERITLQLVAYVGAPQSHDTVQIDGTPNIKSTIEGGLHGDIATAAIVVNSIPRVVGGAAGLITPNNLPLAHWQQG
ncbi:MAG: dihydrodipicolinate reductase [Chloroflexi bacterium]|nr:dihydrodipicolinate reductase [Chloroflexota bacterium]